MQETATTTRERAPLNGVDTPNLLGTINVVRDTPALGAFQFRATNTWMTGTHSRTVIESYSGAGGEHTHRQAFTYDADHPAVLVGADTGPTPVEFLLHALASCLTAGIANISATRGVALTEVRSTVEGDIDLRAIFGLTDEVRNGMTPVDGLYVLGLQFQRRRTSAFIDGVGADAQARAGHVAGLLHADGRPARRA
jgi:hypothetical protein